MSTKKGDDERHKTNSGDADVVRFDRAGEKVRERRADERAAEIATRFHHAMGWKGTPEKPAKNSKGKRSKKKR